MHLPELNRVVFGWEGQVVFSTQVKMNVKPIGAFQSGLTRQVVFERRGLKIQGPLYC